MAKNKYNIKPIETKGIKYDSKAERDRHWVLKQKENAGKIFGLHYHDIRFYLGYSDKNRAITYKPDFTYIEYGQLIAEDVKGPRIRDFPVRAALFKERFPAWELRVVDV